jgi:putative CocE/NonD family hydrolase
MVGTANVFLPGHRIRVDITSSHFPQFDRNPNTGEAFGASSKTRVAKQTIFHTAQRPSHIVLPVVSLPK